MSIPIVIEYDYKMKAEVNLDIDRFEEHFGKMINSVLRSSDPKVSHIDVTFTSDKEIGDIRSEMERMLDFDDCSLMYETLDYEEEYTGGKYFTFFDKRTKTLQCDNCGDFNHAKIPRGERVPCCDECLCACSEFTHKGENAPVEKMRILNVGGISFRVCEDCIPVFTS
ncbi:MAG: hypothetical protein PHG66_04830 [Candidatus Colwellbacteria bacterium]|nr:hypothetical protein [Candidatus Colwellbacteria bacterium]